MDWQDRWASREERLEDGEARTEIGEVVEAHFVDGVLTLMFEEGGERTTVTTVGPTAMVAALRKLPTRQSPQSDRHSALRPRSGTREVRFEIEARTLPSGDAPGTMFTVTARIDGQAP